MSIPRGSKLKWLIENWPNGALLTAKWLREHGYSKSNIQKYLSSGWIESVGEGCYKKHGDQVNYRGAVFALQDQYKCHIGGKTALEMQGAAHYINMQEDDLYLFVNGYKRLPKWVEEGNDYGVNLIFIRTEFIEGNIGINYTQDESTSLGFLVQISSRERAILEYIYLVGKDHSFEECNLIMENLSNLRPDKVQQLLENCHSIKVKRLFLFLARRHNHPYFSELDLCKIDLGSGYRELVKGGIYDPEFNINYPKEWTADEHESKF